MRQLVIAVLLVPAALGLSFYAAPWRTGSSSQQLPEALAEEPDLYMRSATITQHLPTGMPKYRLSSDEIHHFEDDRMTRLQYPSLTLFAHPDPPWEVTSERGTISWLPGRGGATREEVVQLRDDVVLVQNMDNGEKLTLRSESLDIYPDRQYAESDQSVMIDTSVGRTTSEGFRNDLRAGLVSLFSSEQKPVRTIILPEQFD